MYVHVIIAGYFSRGVIIYTDSISLAPRWPNVDPIGSTLGQPGPNVTCYLGKQAFLKRFEGWICMISYMIYSHHA